MVERKTEIETPMLEISAEELIKSLSADSYKNNPPVLQNLTINFTNPDAYGEFEKILELLQVKGLSKVLRSLDVSVIKYPHSPTRTRPYNSIGKLPPSIGALNGLTSLNVRGNSLTTLTGIKHLKVLTSLDASYNHLTTLEGIEQLTALTSLDVNFNKLIWLNT